MTHNEATLCAEILQAHPRFIMEKLASASNTEEAQRFLDEIKKNAHRQLRIKAKELHPDKTTDAKKHELLKNLLTILNELDRSQIEHWILP